MAQILKLEGKTDLKCSGEKFYEIFRKKANKLPEICPTLVTKIEVRKGGDWESKEWTMVVVAGKSEVNVKDESGDDGKKIITYGVKDGEIKKNYKSFKITMEVTTKDQGCSVTLTIDYEKANLEALTPTVYLDFYINVMLAVETHLLANP
ncbi:MLP-like protein 34 [Corylus avellana]|uniref:MLP-like protein 34 n=1 Tax=Corylus avellana TaxID=13451 RepID=UPI00286A0268|nr:MLP-like protein 34 [Corylus avellana]